MHLLLKDTPICMLYLSICWWCWRQRNMRLCCLVKFCQIIYIWPYSHDTNLVFSTKCYILFTSWVLILISCLNVASGCDFGAWFECAPCLCLWFLLYFLSNLLKTHVSCVFIWVIACLKFISGARCLYLAVFNIAI